MVKPLLVYDSIVPAMRKREIGLEHQITYSFILGAVILLLAVFLARFSSAKSEASEKRDD